MAWRAPALLAVVLAASSCSGASQADAGWCKQRWLTQGGRITDEADLLPPETEAALAQKLAALEARNGHQFVIVTTTDLQGKPIEDYSLCLARHRGVGRKGYNDGIVLLVAPNERKTRIEVGYGLEKALRDDEASEILNRTVIPAFAKGDYVGGITRGADAIVAEIQ